MFYPDWLSEVLLWIVGALCASGTAWMVWLFLKPILLPGVWEQAYELGVEDGMAGKPLHTRHFESQNARNGYENGLQDARAVVRRQEERLAQQIDRENLRRSRDGV